MSSALAGPAGQWAYFGCVAAGIALAGIVAKFQRRADGRDVVDPAQRFAVTLAAAIGAIAGAYLFELPADVWHWAWQPTSLDGSGATSGAEVNWPRGDLLPLGGRTVLGGLIGGWLAVEWQKRRLGITVATGDAFAAPLAVSLACGRVGCLFAGCCASRPDAQLMPWLPAPAIEALFHGAAALLLFVAARRDRSADEGATSTAATSGRSRGRRLAAYLALYALLRFALEFERANPRLLARLTYYQWLALLLLAITGSTWWHRRPRPEPSTTQPPPRVRDIAA